MEERTLRVKSEAWLRKAIIACYEQHRADLGLRCTLDEERIPPGEAHSLARDETLNRFHVNPLGWTEAQIDALLDSVSLLYPESGEPPEQEEGHYLGGWGLSDLTDNYFCTEEEAREWFEKHEMRLSEVCCQAGWEYITEYVGFPSLEDDCEECPCCGKLFPVAADEPGEYWTVLDCDCVEDGVVCNHCSILRCVHRPGCPKHDVQR